MGKPLGEPDLPGARVIRWGIIGCGDVCERKSGPALRDAVGSALSMVMRRDGAKAADFARRHAVPEWTDDADRLIASERVDAVYVATPPDSHERFARLAAVAGKPVLVEKPLAHTLESAEALARACAHVPWFCAYYRRHMPRFARVGEALDRIAPLDRVEICERKRAIRNPEGWRHQPGPGEGGLFMDTGSHMIDIVAHLVGEIDLASVAGRAESGRAPLRVTARFAAGGVPVEGVWDYAAAGREDRISFFGAGGEVHTACFTPTPILLKMPGRTVEIGGAYPDPVHRPMVEAVVADLEGGPPASVRGSAALATARVMGRILA